jgi:diguanylate cyclase (GGDEF)-like protein
VAELVQRNPVTIRETCSIEEAARAMASRRYSSLLVVNESGSIVGIVTERDAVRAIATNGGTPLAQRAVQEIMSSPVRSVTASTPLEDAIAELQNLGIRRLLVVDEAGSSVGLVTQTDLLRAALLRLESEQQRLADQVATATEELSRMNSKLQLLARQDGLLGIGNRRALEEALRHEHALARRYGRSWALVLVDVDYFKKFNDRYGHLDGDDALKRVTAALSQCLRASDRLYRYGGEELAIVLAETEIAGAEVFAGRAIDAVRKADIRHEDSPAGVLTVSVGVSGSSLATEAPDWSVMAKLADQALYAAKAAGRNRWVTATAKENAIRLAAQSAAT